MPFLHFTLYSIPVDPRPIKTFINHDIWDCCPPFGTPLEDIPSACLDSIEEWKGDQVGNGVTIRLPQPPFCFLAE